MNFTEAITAVTSITKRPDKATEIRSNLNKALAFYTLKADWAEDLVEASLAIAATTYGETVSLSSLTRFRKFKYVKPRGKRYYLTTIDPTQLLTPTGSLQPNRFYVAGSSLTFTLSELNTHLEIGYYRYAPVLTEVSGSDTHWMLTKMPWAIIERAASQIFKSIGDDSSARFYEDSADEFFRAARRDFADLTANAATS